MRDLVKAGCEVDGVVFGNEKTRLTLKEALTSWMDVKMSAKDVIAKRIAYLKIVYEINFPGGPVNRVSGKLIRQYNNMTESQDLLER